MKKCDEEKMKQMELKIKKGSKRKKERKERSEV